MKQKVKGKRTLKNGATAGYVLQKDGSYKWRIITGPKKTKKGGWGAVIIKKNKESQKGGWGEPIVKKVGGGWGDNLFLK